MATSHDTSKDKPANDVTIIWLDVSITDPTTRRRLQRKHLLHECVKSIRPFIDADTCFEYIHKASDARLILIVSGSLGQIFVPRIHDFSQIIYIYIFCLDPEQHQLWAKEWTKIRGVYQDNPALLTQLDNDLKPLMNVSLPFGLSDSSQRSLKELTTEQASFMWSQLIIEVLLRLPQTPEAKEEMVAQCRSTYRDNPVQLENIEKFDQTYQAQDAIKWYTETGFVYQLFNEAFRKQDFEVIFKYRYFLSDLFKAIQSMYVQQCQDRKKSWTVYRGQMMWKHELMKLKESLGQLISINTFFSTSRSVSVASSFCGNGEYESQGIVSVMFQITIDFDASRRPLAQIDGLSTVADECEVLLSMGAVFRVDSVDLETDTIWFVQLAWDREANAQLQAMERLNGLINFYTGQHIGDHPSILAFGYFLSEMGLLAQARRFYIYLYKTLPADHPARGILYNNLGEVLRKSNSFNMARNLYEKALEFCTDTMSLHHPFWAIIHSNIALLNLNCGKAKSALKCYRYAVFILSRYTTGTALDNFIYVDEALAVIYHGMGTAWTSLARYNKAKTCHDTALKIDLRILPVDHPRLIDSYYVLGHLYTRLENHREALKHYENALRIAQINSLVKDHRYASLNICIAGLTLRLERDQSKALNHCADAREAIERNKQEESRYPHPVMYKALATFYFHLHLMPLAGRMWQEYIRACKQQVADQNDDIDVSIVLQQFKTNKISTPDFNADGNSFLLHEDNQLSSTPVVKLEHIALCEFADEARATGYIQYALKCYRFFLDDYHPLHDPRFDRIHRARLHNNLAACYQDLDDHHNALHHYQSALDFLTVEDRKGNLQTAITHYNIGLIYFELDQGNQARKHLHLSLAQYRRQTQNSMILDVKIYIALIKIYRRWNDWWMVRNYYERIVDQMKKDEAQSSLIEQYEKYLADAIDNIRSTSS